MKKFLAALLAVVMVVGCMLTMTSCSLFDPKPETDIDKAQENLEDNDYLVVVTENTEETPLDFGVVSVLKAYDLVPFIEKMQEEDEEEARRAAERRAYFQRMEEIRRQR